MDYIAINRVISYVITSAVKSISLDPQTNIWQLMMFILFHLENLLFLPDSQDCSVFFSSFTKAWPEIFQIQQWIASRQLRWMDSFRHSRILLNASCKTHVTTCTSAAVLFRHSFAPKRLCLFGCLQLPPWSACAAWLLPPLSSLVGSWRHKKHLHAHHHCHHLSFNDTIICHPNPKYAPSV